MARKKIAVTIGGKRNDVMYETVSGIWRRAREENTDVFVFCCYGGDAAEDTVYNEGEYNIFSLLHPEDYDGFIMVSRNIDSREQRDALHDLLASSGKPAVSIENDLPGMYYAGIDNFSAMHDMASHLIRVHGCRVLSYIGGPYFDYENRKRYRGFCAACTDAGISADRSRIQHYGWSFEDGRQAYREFRDAGRLDADAFVCANDDLAVGFISEAKLDGHSVPADFRVTGFDGSSYANVYSPRISTVDREKETAGYRSCSILLEVMSGIPHLHITRLRSSCIFSESCGCASADSASSCSARCATVDSDLEKEALSAALNSMESVLSKCNSMPEFNDALAGYARLLQARSFYLMINESELRNAPDINASYRTKGYDDIEYVSLEIQDGVQSSHGGHRIPARSIVPTLLDGQCHMYLISPVHFQNRCMGYCVTVDSLELVRASRYFDWLNNLNLTMNIVHEKQIMQILNDKLNMLYMEDAMTGLYNRYGYAMKAVDIFRRNQAAGDATMVMFMDLNQLKRINDTFGHEHGDLAIRTVADAIRRTIPEGFIPIRYGGDEFVIIGRCNDPTVAETLKKNLLGALEEYNRISANHYDVTAAVGYIIAQADEDAPLDDYVRRADAVMYAAKEQFRKNSGRNQ